ncbi:MAG TPA: hypothetical protein VK974_01270 [Methylophilaceae bacterium]|nr:hypothetical protein [Methylophilaceae bacterium]
MKIMQNNIVNHLTDYRHLITLQITEYETHDLETQCKRLKNTIASIDDSLTEFVSFCDSTEGIPLVGINSTFDRRK